MVAVKVAARADGKVDVRVAVRVGARAAAAQPPAEDLGPAHPAGGRADHRTLQCQCRP